MVSDIENWRDVVGYEGLYEVSSKGRVKSLGNNRSKKEKMMNGGVNTTGYRQVALSKKGSPKNHYLVSRLVAINFIPNPLKKRTVNHKDGDILNNNVQNLEWATFSENHKHAYKVLKRVVNIENLTRGVHYRRLSKNDVRQIRDEIRKGVSLAHLGRVYNVSSSAIWKIKHRKSFKFE